MLKKEASWS